MDRKVRSQELGQRQREAANAKRMEDWRRMREKRKLELQAELRGDLSKEEEEQLIQKLKKRERPVGEAKSGVHGSGQEGSDS